MILPIIGFGALVLRKKCKDILEDSDELRILLENMWETMYAASGVGLAAPQINMDIRLFIIDTSPFIEDDELKVEKAVKKVFINAKIIDESGDEWSFSEGCLSIPDLREEVSRKSTIKIEYFDEFFVKHTDIYDGLTARVIQHEYDHIEGVLFTDYISPLRKRMIKGKLIDIRKGKTKTNYKMRFIN
jgi:peptide deformylase